MSDENKNYSFLGLPENIEIEVPDEVAPVSTPNMRDPRNFLRDLSTMSPEQLKSVLPPTAIEEIKEIAEAEGVDIDDIIKKCAETSQNMLKGDLSELFKMFEDLIDDILNDDEDDYDDEDENDCDDCLHGHYELADVKYLNQNYFGSVECEEHNDLYDKFVAVYGVDSTKYLDPNIGVKDFNYTNITAQLPLQNIKNLKYISANNKFILFFAEPEMENLFGFFVAIIKDEKGFSLYVPEFRNTFNVDSEGNVSLFDPKEEESLFSIDSNGIASFDHLSLESIEFAINFALAPKKRCLLTPHQFGIIKNTIPPITGDGMFLKVGMITSNEKPESILLKKDAELDVNEVTFPLYFNFGRVIEKGSLEEISQILFKTDLNKCRLLDFCELKYTNDHRLYIDVDLGDF